MMLHASHNTTRKTTERLLPLPNSTWRRQEEQAADNNNNKIQLLLLLLHCCLHFFLFRLVGGVPLRAFFDSSDCPEKVGHVRIFAFQSGCWEKSNCYATIWLRGPGRPSGNRVPRRLLELFVFSTKCEH